MRKILLVFLLLTLTRLNSLVLRRDQAKEHFDEVLLSIRECGMHPPPDTFKDICAHQNNEEPTFRKLVFMIFCCSSSKLNNRTADCSLDLRSPNTEELVEKEASIDAGESFYYQESAIKLLSFCYYLNTAHAEEMQKIVFDKLQQMAEEQSRRKNESMAMINEINSRQTNFSTSFAALLRNQKKKVRTIRRFRISAGLVREKLRRVRRSIKDQSLNEQMGRYSSLDLVLGNHTFVLFWLLYLLLSCCPSDRLFVRKKSRVFPMLLFANLASIVIDYSVVSKFMLWADPTKTRLLFKTLNFCYFLYGLRSVVGSRYEFERLRGLQEIQKSTFEMVRRREELRKRREDHCRRPAADYN